MRHERISPGIIPNYEEKAPFSKGMKGIITSGFLLLAISYFFSIFSHSFGLEKTSNGALNTLLLAIMIYSLAMWSFLSMKFRITRSGVEAVMQPFTYHIPYTKIREVKTINNIPWYIGWGVRIWGRRIAFVSMHKSAVVVGKEGGFFRKLILTAENPHEFVRLIEKKRGEYS